MKNYKLVSIIPLSLALFTGAAHSQGNPHQDSAVQSAALDGSRTVALYQGNPHLGVETKNNEIAEYRGNPHEGYIVRVEHIAAAQGNPHAGFRMVPLAVASAE